MNTFLNKNLILILGVSAILSTGIAGESWAEVLHTWNCGTSCTATLDDQGNFVVNGSGPMTDYEAVKTSDDKPVITTAPWADYLTQITNLEINGVSSIGKAAFYNNPGLSGVVTNNVSVKIDDSVEEIHGSAFHGIGMRDLEMSDSVKTIGSYAFTGNKLTQITLPETLSYLANSALGRDGDTTGLTIICKGSNCSKLENLLKKYAYTTSISIPKDLSGAMVPADDTNCDSTNYYWSGTSCHNKKNGINCAANFRADSGHCYRIRYTPAEAAEVAGDTNTIFLYYK